MLLTRSVLVVYPGCLDLKKSVCYIPFVVPDYPLRDLKQDAYWLTSWGINMPWVGLEKKGCNYLNNNCTAENVTESQKFSYPIHIRKEYPRVSSIWIFSYSASNFFPIMQ